MFTSSHTPAVRLSLDDFELVVALAQQRAADGDAIQGRVALALETVLQVRRAKAGVSARAGALQQAPATPCRHRLHAVARRCWAGMNAPLSLHWTRGLPLAMSARR